MDWSKRYWKYESPLDPGVAAVERWATVEAWLDEHIESNSDAPPQLRAACLFRLGMQRLRPLRIVIPLRSLWPQVTTTRR